MSARGLTPDEAFALTVAEQLISAGIPVFAAPPVVGADGEWDPTAGADGYQLPSNWQNIEPDVGWLDPFAEGFTDTAWRPGWALGAVMGRGLDLLDIDPRHGGHESRRQLEEAGVWPRVYAAANTPSGGTHDFVASMGVRSRTGVLPGFDVKAGLADGYSRGFAFIAPTVRLSKVTGDPVAHSWATVSELVKLGLEDDDTVQGMVQLLQANRPPKNTAAACATPYARGRLRADEGSIPGGQRHEELVSYAGWMRSRAVPIQEAKEQMRRRWQQCTQPPLADHEFTWEEAEALLHSVFDLYDAPPTGGSDYERRVAAEVVTLRVREEAARIVRQERTGALERPTLIRLTDFLAVADDQAQYRVDRVWPVGGRAVLAAQYKAGKTTLRNNLVRSLVDGDPFLGEFPVTPFEGTVVLIDNELDDRMLRRWMREQGIKNTDRIYVLPLRGRVGSLDLLDDQVRARFASMIREVQGAVVLFDCLRPVLDALGLSEDKDAGRFLVAFDALLAESGASEAVVIHHMGHSGERSRGDTRLRDWPDVEWQLIREGADGEQLADASRFFKAYGRDVDVPEGLLEYDAETRRMSLAGGSRRQTAAERLIPDVLGYLDTHPGVSKRNIEDGLKEYRRADVRAAIKASASQGLIRTAPGPRNSTLHWVDDPDVQASAPSAPAVRRRAADECASAPIEGALSTTESERLMHGALAWLPKQMPSRRIVYAAA